MAYSSTELLAIFRLSECEELNVLDHVPAHLPQWRHGLMTVSPHGVSSMCN